MLNKIQLIGRLGNDAELKTIESGQTYAKFSLATSEKYKDKNGESKEKTEWHNVIFWGKPAETVAKYCKKGMLIYVEGKIATRTWQTEAGENRYMTEVLGQNFSFLESAKANATDQPTTQSPSLGEVVVSDDLPF